MIKSTSQCLTLKSNRMKTIKYLALLLAATLVYSCSKDDTTSIDPIVGTWQLTAVTITQNGEVTEETPSECESKTNFEFRANQAVTSNRFINTTNCFEASPEAGIWVNNEDGTYITTLANANFITLKNNTFTTLDSPDLFGTIIERTFTQVP